MGLSLQIKESILTASPTMSFRVLWLPIPILIIVPVLVALMSLMACILVSVLPILHRLLQRQIIPQSLLQADSIQYQRQILWGFRLIYRRFITALFRMAYVITPTLSLVGLLPEYRVIILFFRSVMAVRLIICTDRKS